MSTRVETSESAADKPDAREQVKRDLGLRWWREAIFVLLFYAIYSAVRNLTGSNAVEESTALTNAKHVIRWEEWLHIFNEERIQQFFYDNTGFMRFWNIFYGTAHFVVTIAALMWLFHRAPERYSRWRTALATTTALALIGFALFPLLPPRLLPESYGFQDSLEHIGGLWSFESGAISKVSNQYAAMPSLHFAWSTWCALVFWPALPKWWQRLLALSYPASTLFAIVVTANHYWLDAVGGAAVLALGWLVASKVTSHPARMIDDLQTPIAFSDHQR